MLYILKPLDYETIASNCIMVSKNFILLFVLSKQLCNLLCTFINFSCSLVTRFCVNGGRILKFYCILSLQNHIFIILNYYFVF